MAICPFATKKLIPAGPNDPRITVRAAILHVDAGNAESLFGQFSNQAVGIESHFFVKKTGELEQYRDTAFQADANLDANDFAISIETQGFGLGEWTPEQVDTIERLLLWINKTHGVPLRKIQTWDGSGIGYHTLFGAPSHWTPVAKTCPGPDRIKQFNAVLVPWMATGGKVAPDPTPTPNITDALKANTREERRAALKKVVKRGSDNAQQAALAWLKALDAIDAAQARAKSAYANLKDEEVRP